MSSYASGYNQTNINLDAAAGEVDRVPVAPNPISAGTGTDPVSWGLTAAAVATTSTAYSNSNSLVLVPSSYLASFPAGSTFSARALSVSPASNGTAIVTAVTPNALNSDFTALALTIEGISADASDTTTFFAIYVGVSDNSPAPGVPTTTTEQFAGWFILETDVP